MGLVAVRSNGGVFGLGWGAAAGEELGGMVLVTPTSVAVTGTGSSATIGANGSVSLTSCATASFNGVFSVNYDNYVVIFRSVGAGSGTKWDVRLRASGSDNSTASSYVRQELDADGTTISAGRASFDRFEGPHTDRTTVDQNGTTLNFYGPFLSQPTAMRSFSVQSVSSAYLIDKAYTHNQSVSYDGFTIVAASGSPNICEGVVSVYGLVGA